MSPQTASTRDMAGKVALVTGAASGIGAASAVQLSAAGATVVCADLDIDGARSTAQQIVASGGAAEAVGLDVSDDESVTSAVDFVVDKYGRVDIAVNSAGITGPARTDLLSTTTDAWRRVLDVNLTGVFFCLRAEIAAMTRCGGGSIVNIASILGLVGRTDQSAYVAAKHGVIGVTRAAALEYADRGVRVNAVCPGYIDTAMIAQMPSEARAQVTGLHPIGRLGTSDEVAEMVTFLASDRAKFVTGGHYSVDGGYTAV